MQGTGYIDYKSD